MAHDFIDDLLERVKRSRQVTLTGEEADQLEKATPLPLEARKLLSAHYHRVRDYTRAIMHTEAACVAEPNRQNANNLISMLTLARRFQAAHAALETHGGQLEDYERAQSLCAILYGLGKQDRALEAGREALRLKDAMAPVVDRPPPVTRPFDVRQPDRNIIAFSLFGGERRYLQGAVTNTVVARYLYPGWRPRFYVDDTVPAETIERLLREGAQVRKTPNLPAATYGLFWRFLVEDDEDVDLYLIRDADSVMNIRERAAVEDWLSSGRAFHVMRDFPTHCELILAGMWGAHRGNLGRIGPAILRFAKANASQLNDRIADQRFLREHVWPLMRGHVLVHDTWFGYGDAVPFRGEFSLPWPMHVGQNDAVHFVPSNPSTKT